MTRYSVIITDPNRNHGLGPVDVEAADPDAAVEIVLADEGRTREQFAAVGLTAIIVREAD